MAESDEAAFLASMKAANEAQGTYEVDDRTGAVTESINTSDEYDPTQAVSTVQSLPQNAQESPLHQISSSVLLNETMSTSNVSNVSSAVLHTSPDPPVLNGLDRQSESRSMSRATTSDGSHTLAADQVKVEPPHEQAESAKDIATDSGEARPDNEQMPSADPANGLDSLAVTPLPGAEDAPVASLQNDQIASTASDAPPADEPTVTDGQGTAEAVQDGSKDAAASSTMQASTTAGTTLPKARLPHDTLGILEDRIKEDPRGDVDAWLSLNIGNETSWTKLEAFMSDFLLFSQRRYVSILRTSRKTVR